MKSLKEPYNKRIEKKKQSSKEKDTLENNINQNNKKSEHCIGNPNIIANESLLRSNPSLPEEKKRNTDNPKLAINGQVMPKNSLDQTEKIPTNYISTMINNVNTINKNDGSQSNLMNQEDEKTNQITQEETNNIVNNVSKIKNVVKSDKKPVNNKQMEKCQNPPCDKYLSLAKEKFKVELKGFSKQERVVCKKCFEAAIKNQFCFYCNSIYRFGLKDFSGYNNWVRCDKCKKWIHSKCEVEKGNQYMSEKELNESKYYICPICIKANEEIETQNIDLNINKSLTQKKRKRDQLEATTKAKNEYKKNLRDVKTEKYSELLHDFHLIQLAVKKNNNS